MSRKFVFFYIVSPILLAGLFLAFESYAKGPGNDTLFAQAEMIAEVRRLILDSYVQEVDEEQLFQGAMKGMVSELGDPYSQYLDPETYADMTADTEGEFGGLGIQVTLQDGVLTVISPIAGTPASDVGILPGDKILEIEGESTENYRLSDAVGKLRGKPGTKVTITILHKGKTETEKVTITRAKIKVKSIKWPRIVDAENGIAYVALIAFQETTAEELTSALDKLDEQGMKALVLDMRFNPGGLLDQSRKVSDIFIEKGTIVSMKGRLRSSTKSLEATAENTRKDLPVVVLINGGSASASEIVAGALQDHRRAVVLGERSYGKGSVQSIMVLRDKKSGLKVTTAYYYTPAGRNISRTKTSRGGIEPDVPVALDTKELEDLIKLRRQLDIEINTDGKQKVDPKLEDKQLLKAIEALKGKRVYDKLRSGNG